jgi:hypothetical protein
VEGLDAGIALCQRNSQRLDESENEVRCRDPFPFSNLLFVNDGSVALLVLMVYSCSSFSVALGPQVLWFKLLDAVVIPLRRLKSQRNRMKVTKPNFNAAAGGPGQKMDGTTSQWITPQSNLLTSQRSSIYAVCGAVRCAL